MTSAVWLSWSTRRYHYRGTTHTDPEATDGGPQLRPDDQDLARRPARELGRREHPHHESRRPLRIERVRGHPLLRDAHRRGSLSSPGPHAAPPGLVQDLPDPDAPLG